MQLRQLDGIRLNQGEASRDPAAVDKAARELEGAFARMLISSMRQSGLGEEDALFPGAAGHYRDLYDAQLAGALTEGRGLGLQAAIRRQLGGEAGDGKTTPPGSPATAPLPARNGVHIPLPAPATDTAASAATRPAAATATPPRGARSAPPADGGALPAAIEARLSALMARTLGDTGGDALNPTALSALALPPTPYELPALRATARSRFAETQAAAGPEDFVARIWPQAEKAAAELGVPARMIVAQAALETGWGRHLPRQADGSPSGGLFGIKAGGHWTGKAVSATTTEFTGGVARQEQASFRAYDSIADSFADYVSLLKNNPRYTDAVGATDGRTFARALQRGGYATDPDYAAKLTAIAEGPTLRRALEKLAGAPASPSLKA